MYSYLHSVFGGNSAIFENRCWRTIFVNGHLSGIRIGVLTCRTISELNTILEKTKIDTPVIFIGHSVGGVYARHFTDQYPKKVAGLILIDLRNEFFKEAAPTYNKKFFNS